LTDAGPPVTRLPRGELAANALRRFALDRLRRVRDEHRARRVEQHVARDAAEHEPLEAGLPAAADDDAVGPVLAGRGDELGRGIAFALLGCGRHAELLERLRALARE